MFAIGIKIFHRALFEKIEFSNFQYFQIFFPTQTAPVGQYDPYFITFFLPDMLDIMYCELEMCCLCKKMP